MSRMVLAENSTCTPYIGVMCIDLVQALGRHFPRDLWHSYLPASYVQYLVASGAMVIPIWIGRECEYYRDIMAKVNGVLLPGGAVFIDEDEARKQPELTNDCVRSARYIYELAAERNAAGEYFPLWGTCLGFQLMLINAAQSSEVRTKCQRMFAALPLWLSQDYQESAMFRELPQRVAAQMTSVPFACHHHTYCITRQSLAQFKLHKDWRVLATAVDESNSTEIITIIEHRTLPFFGVQFHPERTAFEQVFARWDHCSAAHTTLGIQLARYFADFFVDACRRNGNRFASIEEQARHIICNWQPVFCGQFKDSNWLQCYLFTKDEQYPHLM